MSFPLSLAFIANTSASFLLHDGAIVSIAKRSDSNPNVFFITVVFKRFLNNRRLGDGPKHRAFSYANIHTKYRFVKCFLRFLF